MKEICNFIHAFLCQKYDLVEHRFSNIINVIYSISRSVHVGDNCLFDNNDRLIALCMNNSKHLSRIIMMIMTVE